MLLFRFVQFIFNQNLLFTFTKIPIFFSFLETVSLCSFVKNSHCYESVIGSVLLCLFLPSKITVLSFLSRIVLFPS